MCIQQKCILNGLLTPSYSSIVKPTTCNISAIYLRVVELCISFHICSTDMFTYFVPGILNKAFNPLDK